MVPYGAGSSVEGNFSSTYPGICIDLSLMDQIVEFHPDDLDVTVQAGVNWTQLNESNELKESGLFLPIDPSPTAQIGGMIATNCSGTNAMRYGTMKDYVLNLTVVLADGSVIKTRRRPRKTSAGYNLNSLFTGSEGTLGIITEATLKLAVVPSDYSVATATFLTVKDAADAASKMIRKGVNLAACELMDDEQMKVINKSGGVGGKMWEELPTLFLKFSGSQRNIEDSVRLAHSVKESKNDAIQLGLFSSVLGHVGDGNFHQMIMYDPKRPSDVANVKSLINGMMHKALNMEGTVSHCLLEELGSDTIGVMKAIKDRLDPHWLMNPGKIFDE
ncbi:D-lactate dehydrogenase [Colletotrichum tropicale]|nr:D-lactate dehydrogenase [Colletotrichum tropicale]